MHNFAATKVGAIVGGQTSCKAPEVLAFEEWMPQDVDIVSIHSLHAPGVDPKGQPLVSQEHRPPLPGLTHSRSLFSIELPIKVARKLNTYYPALVLE